MQLEYFETVLHTYFSPEAHEALKSLQGLLLEKACESSSEPNENPGHQRRSTRGSEDAMTDDKPQGPTVSPDDLLVRFFSIHAVHHGSFTDIILLSPLLNSFVLPQIC